MAQKKFNLDKQAKAVKTQLERAMTLIGNEAKNHFVQSFRDGGFTDKSLKKWEPRKNQNKKSAGRGILVKSGDLRRSIIRRPVNKQALSVKITTDLIYAAVHNDGLMAGRGRGFKMPKRQFIGNSYQLNEKVKKIIVQQTDKAFK
jgi:phage gpG-like protein